MSDTRTEIISLEDIRDRLGVEYNYIENGVPLSGYESSDGPPIADNLLVTSSGISMDVTTFFEGRLCQTNFRIVRDLKALAAIVANLGQTNIAPMKYITISSNDSSADYLENKLLDGDGVELIKSTDSTGGSDENITINTRYKNSVVTDDDQLQLKNDTQVPGRDKYYGTDENGIHGWYDYIDNDRRLAVSETDDVTDYLFNKLSDGEGLIASITTESNGSETMVLDIQTKNSVEIDNDFIHLVNDENNPGGFKSYGTDLLGNKGWYDSSLTLLSNTDEVPDFLQDKIIDGYGILLTYDTNSSGSETLSINVRTKKSLTIDSDELQFINDEAAPGAFKLYGTDNNGVKGWIDGSKLRISASDTEEEYLHDKITSGNTTSITTETDSAGVETLQIDVDYKNSITVDSNMLQLLNDANSPGNSKFYGTNTSGVKGWHNLPVDKSVVLSGNELQLYQDQTSPGTNKYYGTNNDGDKGFHTLPAIVAGALFAEGSLNVTTEEDSAGEHLYFVSLINDNDTVEPHHYYGTGLDDSKGWQTLSNLPNEIALGGDVEGDSTGIVDYPVLRRCSVHPSTGVISNMGIDGNDIALSSDGVNADQQIIAARVWNAVWNDIADFQDLGDKLRYGKCYYDSEEDAKICNKRCQKGVIGIASDTFGYALGVGVGKVPIAVSGWVLAYVDREYERGTPLTNDSNGNLTEMILEEKQNYPERMVAIYKKKETAIEWGANDALIKVNGRHWVKVK